MTANVNEVSLEMMKAVMKLTVVMVAQFCELHTTELYTLNG